MKKLFIVFISLIFLLSWGHASKANPGLESGYVVPEIVKPPLDQSVEANFATLVPISGDTTDSLPSALQEAVEVDINNVETMITSRAYTPNSDQQIELGSVDEAASVIDPVFNSVIDVENSPFFTEATGLYSEVYMDLASELELTEIDTQLQSNLSVWHSEQSTTIDDFNGEFEATLTNEIYFDVVKVNAELKYMSVDGHEELSGVLEIRTPSSIDLPILGNSATIVAGVGYDATAQNQYDSSNVFANQLSFNDTGNQKLHVKVALEFM